MAWRQLGLVGPLAMLLASGCAFHWNVASEAEHPVAAPKKEQFGELITAPGQRVPKTAFRTHPQVLP
jgi:hypothetical protein